MRADKGHLIRWLLSCSQEAVMRGHLSDRPTFSKRPEKDAGLRRLYDQNKKIILATQSICGICGKPVDKSIRYPDPMSPTVDHIIPVSRNGDPVAIENLQLAHRCCNRMKSDKMPSPPPEAPDPNKGLPQAVNWRTF